MCAQTKEYWSSKFKHTRILEPFFDSEKEMNNFLNMLSLTGAIISGSIALQLFDRTDFNDNKMDIYVNMKYYHDAETFLEENNFLKKTQNSQELKSVVQDSYPFVDEITKIQALRKRNSNKIIQLMGTRDSPIFAILNFHSSKPLTTT